MTSHDTLQQAIRRLIDLKRELERDELFSLGIDASIDELYEMLNELEDE